VHGVSGSGNSGPSGNLLQIEVVYALPERQWRVAITLPSGATVADALAAVAEREPFVNLDLANVPVGIYGDQVRREQVLADRDRVEIYRPLPVDPPEARRRRSARRG
jgi:putative ubiquitin-RnfH superfamily antitoxin RatB of RatAB toxin-antitoxin module